MTTKKFTERKLLALVNLKLQDHLKEKGFLFYPNLNVFKREVNGIIDEIRVNIAKRGSEGRIFSVWIYIHFGISEVAQLVREFIAQGRDDSNLDIVHIGTDLHNIEPNIVPKSWLIDSQDTEDINTAIISMRLTLENIGLPFIEMLHDLDILHDTLIKNDRLAWLITGDHKNRCATIVAIAKITGKIYDPSYYESFRESCKDCLGYFSINDD